MSKSKLFLILIAGTFITTAKAQSGKPGADGLGGRVNLEDVQIKGESNKDGVRFDQRSQFNVKDRIKFRTSFLDRVEENGSVFLDEETVVDKTP